MKYIYLVAIFLISCNPLKKTQRYLFEHPEFSSGYCAEQYPVKDSVLVRYDTVLDLGEYVDIVPNDTVRKDSFIYITNTVTKTIYKTIRKDSIIYRRDGAEERRLQLALIACQGNSNIMMDNFNKQAQQLAIWQGRAKKRFWLIVALIGGAVVYTGMKLKKRFLV